MAEKRKTQVIAVGNQKGGVGKTTNTLHLAAALGELGKKSLIIDLDGNCGATRGLGVGTDWLGTFEVYSETSSQAMSSWGPIRPKVLNCRTTSK